MTLTLTLPPEVEHRLEAEAARRGVPLEELAVSVLEEALSGTEEEMPQTPAEAMEYWRREGLLGLFADRGDVVGFTEGLRRRAETRGGY